jgi:predicted 3-demethylubiquinone-9 3-methyltransferase (glyoxalase superfamily)
MPNVRPFLWYNDRAEEAMAFYASIFPDAAVKRTGSSGGILRIGDLELMTFNGGPHYAFTPAISLFVSCATQDEIDYYWEHLSAGGETNRCGWLTDKYGLSWQIVPDVLGDLLGDDDEEKADRAMQAMLGMTKLDIAALQRAHAG